MSAPDSEREQRSRLPRAGVIAVRPASALAHYRSLFSALETCFPIRFATGEEAPASARLLVDGSLTDLEGARSEGAPVRSLIVMGGTSRHRGPLPITFAEDHAVPVSLRTRTLIERGASPVSMLPEEGTTALASCAGSPVWARCDAHPLTQVSTLPLSPLAAGEPLREHLRAGRFAALLPLLGLIDHASPEPSFTAQPRRACFIIDDPNLHRPRYGHVDYRRLGKAAREHGYHVAVATVPLDAWHVDERAARVFREDPAALSLLVHGNDHTRRELSRLRRAECAERAMAQAARRIARLEARSGLHVAKVMAPPHGACSEQALRAMGRLGFEAACISRPYPWLGPADPLPVDAGWRPADLVAGGMPVLPRHPIDGDPDELVLRAMLGHPLIVYCHHQDLADPDTLCRAAAEIERLGAVQWLAPERIARASHRTKLEGDTLLVESSSVRAEVHVPRGAARIEVTLPLRDPAPLWRGVRCAGQTTKIAPGTGGWHGEASFDVPAATTVEVRLEPVGPLEPQLVRARCPRPWPIVRRALVEGRDRAQGAIAGPPPGDRRKRVHHVGPDPALVGGIGSVIAVMAANGMGGLEGEAVPTWRPGPRRVSALLAGRAAVRLCRMGAGEIAHIHLAEGGSFVREGALVLLARALGKTALVTVHGSRFMPFAERHGRLVGTVLRAAPVITCLSCEARALIGRLAPKAHVELLANPVELDPGSGPADATEEVALFAGEIGERKGADVLAAAWRAVSSARPEARCLMVGPLSGPVPAGSPRLEIMEPVSRAQVKRLIREARVVVLPSRAEGMPMVLTEAMAAGRPFVATAVGGISELADGGRLVPAGDREALASELLALLADPRLARELGERGRDFCTRTRSIEVVSARLAALYELATARTRRPQARR